MPIFSRYNVTTDAELAAYESDGDRLEREADTEAETMPCGCTDYHYADCSIRTANYAPDPSDFYDDDYR